MNGLLEKIREQHRSYLSNISQHHGLRFSYERLNVVKDLYSFITTDSGNLIRDISDLKNSIDADGIAFVLLAEKDLEIVHKGLLPRKSPLDINEELELYALQPVHSNYLYYVPVTYEIYVIGYVVIYKKNLVHQYSYLNIVSLYIRLLERELKLIAQRSIVSTEHQAHTEVRNEINSIRKVYGQMLGVTTHDLFSPLNAASGYLDLIDDALEKQDLGDETATYHKRLKRCLDDITDLVSQLNEFSRVERGISSIRFVNVDLNWIARDVCNTLECLAAEKNQILEFEESVNMAIVKTDIKKMKRILYNLIHNAIKYTKPDGNIKVIVMADDKEVRLSVQDNGKGIPESMQEKIFEPYKQVSKSSNQQSSGLGLYICSKFTKLLNGQLTLESQLNQGSRFTLHLPVVKTFLQI